MQRLSAHCYTALHPQSTRCLILDHIISSCWLAVPENWPASSVYYGVRTCLKSDVTIAPELESHPSMSRAPITVGSVASPVSTCVNEACNITNTTD
ncbi:hypothetical protein M404DRAFT_758056 [Pisolithus tinctorius Marx 270]|uniref:Uncharacterized protein n=1 Tax=Pisolithus tinctorius Marx 270 TaxID=870435 RepID=A0A0C3JT75_PISTI|nr:hypothetical protein M404DRAFT_758056 [Pisolithus tinctorius Marx 270]